MAISLLPKSFQCVGITLHYLFLCKTTAQHGVEHFGEIGVVAIVVYEVVSQTVLVCILHCRAIIIRTKPRIHSVVNVAVAGQIT